MDTNRRNTGVDLPVNDDDDKDPDDGSCCQNIVT